MKKKLLLILSLVLSMGVFTACGANKEPAPEAKPDQSQETEVGEDLQEVSLSSWEEVNKVWNSITTFYQEDYLVAEAEEIAKKEDKTAQDILAEHEEGAHCEIGAMEFSGDNITLRDDAGAEIANSDYKYVKTIGKGEDHGEFAIFEAVDEVPEQFKFLALMEPHGGEGDITHFHARYGKTVDDPGLTDGNWWPVFVDPDSTQEQVVNEILGSHDHED